MINKRNSLLALLLEVSLSVGCSSLNSTPYGTSYENLKKAVWVGTSYVRVGAIVGKHNVITVYDQDAIVKNDKYERCVTTIRAFLGPIRYYDYDIRTLWKPIKFNANLNTALIETEDNLKKGPIEIADVKLGNCIIVSIDPSIYTDGVIVPYDRKAEITELYEEDLWKVYNNSDVFLKKGMGELILREGETKKFLCFTISNGKNNFFFEHDLGSLVLQDNKLVGIITLRDPEKKDAAYFARGSELEKLLIDYKEKKLLEEYDNKNLKTIKTSDLKDLLKEK